MFDYARLLEILTKLISFRTVTHDIKTNAACLDYIEKLVSSTGLFVHRYTSNGEASLIIGTHDSKHASVLLQAHLDVVPGHDEQFTLRQEEGKLYGRGTYDMKFAAACYLELIEDLKAELPQSNFIIMLTTDEEDGGHNGVEYLLNQGYSADVCILPDSGEEWSIEASAKGFAVAEIAVEGKSAHASRPWQGDNAALKLAALVQLIESEFSYTSPLDDIVTLTLIRAGDAYNQIPDMATATFDIRYVSEDSYLEIKKRLTAICEANDAHAHFIAQAAAIRHDTAYPAFEIWQDITTKVTGAESKYTHSFAASDARYLVPLGIPTISTRPKGGGHHGPEEWISEKGLYDFYEILKQFVVSVARSAD